MYLLSNDKHCQQGVFLTSTLLTYGLTILGRAAILLYPGDTEASAQSSLVLTCVAFGIPAPEIVWEHNNLTLTSPHSNITTEIFSNDTGLFAVSVLNLCNVELSDSGQYSCLASNSGMNTETRSFTLNIQGTMLLDPQLCCPIASFVCFHSVYHGIVMGSLV